MKAKKRLHTGKVFGFQREHEMINPIKIQDEIKKLIQVLSTLGYAFSYDEKMNIVTIRRKEDINEER